MKRNPIIENKTPVQKVDFHFPSHIYKEKYGTKNYISKELISKNIKEVEIKSIGKGLSVAFVLKSLEGEETLLIKRANNSKLLDEYSEILSIENGELTFDAIKANTNTYKWIKHPRLQSKINIDDNYLAHIINTRGDNFVIRQSDATTGVRGFWEPQIGALYSIFSNYTVSKKTSTIVMPTGTGKTETMLGALMKLHCKRLLVIVPTDALRDQLAEKFITLGKFRELDLINAACETPTVGVLKKKLISTDEINAFFSKTNVVVSTINILGGLSDDNQKHISDLCSHLFIDEAHHTPAKTRNRFKMNFGDTNIIQFTATPFRNDKKIIDGKIIYNYPLKKAQDEGYFTEISFKPVLEFDESQVDIKIRDIAIQQLRDDISAGKNHVLMVRCENIEKAENIYNTYYKDFTEFSPILIHSKVSDTEKKIRLNQLKTLSSKIVVCVDMLGEGYDLPNLKIAALHYAHKSLGVTLQFIGRFTRISGINIGKATFVANIADKNFQDTLKELYSENSNWNHIISKESGTIIKKQIKFEEFIAGFEDLDIEDFNVALQNIKVPFSSRFFKPITGDVVDWSNDNIEKCINDNFNKENVRYSVNNIEKILVVIEKNDGYPIFGSFKELNEVNYNIHVIAYDDANKLFYILSDDFMRMNSIISSFGGLYQVISGEDPFKAFYGLEMLQLFIVGFKEGLPGNIKYRMHAGIDIRSALTNRDGINKMKSNIFGFGFEDGMSTSMGASRKGKIRSKLNGTLYEWKERCQKIGRKLLNPVANGDNIVDWVLKLDKAITIPKLYPISIEWSEEVYRNYDKIGFKLDGESAIIGIEDVSIELINQTNNGSIEFKIFSDSFETSIRLLVDESGFLYEKISGNDILLVRGSKEYKIIAFLTEFSPIIRFYEGSFLEGNHLTKIDFAIVGYNTINISIKDWTGVDIKKESQGLTSKLQNSIQYSIIQSLIQTGEYDLIFNDDGAGEIADIVGIKIDDTEQEILLELYHCKYSKDKNPGSRIEDLYTVCGQAQRSVRWTSLENTLKQIMERGIKHVGRYELGDMDVVNKLNRMLQLYKTSTIIYIVQPGVSKSRISDEQKKLLEVTENYLKNTFNISLKIIASQ